MPSLKAIKKRIHSVKNTQKITKAMKMVAAAKLRRAQTAAQNGRHYTEAISGLALRLAAGLKENISVLMRSKEKVARRDYLILTSDRGLCGGFNSNLLRKLGDELEACREANIEVHCRLIGKKGRDYFKSRNWALSESATNVYENFGRGIAEGLAKVGAHRFESGKTDEVYLVYNYFKSAMIQRTTFEKILPVAPSGAVTRTGIDYIFEPSAALVLDQLLKENLVAQIHSAFLESMASELAARMTAMDNATSNASDMIGALSLQYNRARQATITRELMDIVGGAEALG